MANYNRGRGHPKQVVGGGDSVNLMSRTKKKRTWKVKYQATERDPEEEEPEIKDIGYSKAPFDAEKIYQLISEVVDKTFVVELEDEEAEPQPYVYNANENVNLCQRISKEIRDTLKTWRQLMRYRIIALVSVVEKNHQGIHYKMKYVLDPKTDNYVRYYLDNPNFFIIVCVILIFQD